MRTHITFRTLLIAAVAGLLVLAGCAPAAGGGQPLIAVLNGPASGRIAGSAEVLQQDMSRQGPLHFAFVNGSAMRFAEGHNDFHHDRAITSAGRVARSYGAPYAVLIGAPTLKRTIALSRSGGARSVDVTVQMEAVVVDAANDQVVSRLTSQSMERVRYESTDITVPPIQQDPTAQALRDQGVADLAPAVVGALWSGLGIDAGASGG